MGTAASTVGTGVELTLDQQIQRILSTFENYDASATISREELSIAEAAWTGIVSDLSPEYIRMKEENDPNLPHSCLSWFYDSFFALATAYDPNIKDSYNGNMKVQIRAMISMISASLSILRSGDLSNSLLRVAKAHVKRGIRSHQYPIVANVCVKTFVVCMGKYWKVKLEAVWTKIFSVILTTLVPMAIKLEKSSNQTSTLSTSDSSPTRVLRDSFDVSDKIPSELESDKLKGSRDGTDSDLLRSRDESEAFAFFDKEISPTASAE